MHQRAAAVAAAMMTIVVPAEEIGVNVATVRHCTGIRSVCGRGDGKFLGGEATQDHAVQRLVLAFVRERKVITSASS